MPLPSSSENAANTGVDRTGFAAALGAFFLWGILPAYWKMLGGIDVGVVVAHRVAWSLVAVLPILMLRGSLRDALRSFRSPRALLVHFLAALLLTGNWLLYVHATLTERILEGALGYFLNPLVTLLLALVFLGERLSRQQILAAILATIGVGIQISALGTVPWIALGLAGSFAFYGLIRKRSPLGAVSGTAVESLLVLPVALVFLALTPAPGWHEAGSGARFLLVGTGPVTVIPLLLFAVATRRIPLGLVGILQFLGPSLQFLIGWAVFKEPLPPARLLSFLFIWAAVALYIHPMLKRVKSGDGP